MTTPENGSLIRLDNVSRIFHIGDVAVPALVDASMEVQRGEFVVVLGPSGSGKSTLLNIVGGIDRATRGHTWYRGSDLSQLTDQALTAYRREQVGFIFQFYNLVPSLTAYENVQAAAELVAEPLDPAQALQWVDLEDRAAHFPAQMSGGEQQRVAIARALAKKPQLILADEPTGALDLEMARTVLGILERLNQQQHLTVLLITHNPAITGLAHRIIRMASGRIAEAKRNERVLPASEISW